MKRILDTCQGRIKEFSKGGGGRGGALLKQFSVVLRGRKFYIKKSSIWPKIGRVRA